MASETRYISVFTNALTLIIYIGPESVNSNYLLSPQAVNIIIFY